MLVFVVGLLLTSVLVVRRVKGALLIGIVVSTVLAIIIEAVADIGPRTGADGSEVNAHGWALQVPKLPDNIVDKPDLSIIGNFSLFGGFERIGVIAALLIVFSLMIADFFDTVGTVTAVGAEGGCSTRTATCPSRSRCCWSTRWPPRPVARAASRRTRPTSRAPPGVADGARTGLASVVTGVLFLVAMFFSPAGAGRAVGGRRAGAGDRRRADDQPGPGLVWDDMSLVIPAFLTIALMPFTYSITNGIGAGVISYVLLRTVTGRRRDVHPLMWVIAVLFVVYFAAPQRKPAGSSTSPKLRPTGVGTPPASYPAIAKAPAHRSAVKTTSATVTDPQGDSLSVTNAVVGSFNQFNYQAYVGTYNGYYYEDCLDPTPAFGAVTLPFCTSVQLTDAQTGSQASTNNSQYDAVYDACGTLVGQYTTYGWRLGNNSYLSSGYIGSWPYTLPTAGVCWGTWSLVFSFTETFNDGQTLSETASSTFPAYLSLAETIAKQYPQGTPNGGPVDPSEEYGGCSDGHGVHGSATGYPVDTASGDFWHSFTDLTVPGRGPALKLSRTYNSATASTDSRFGYGWIDSYSLSLAVNGSTAVARCEGGATMTFTANGSSWTAPPRVLASLTHNGDGSWTLVRHAQKTYRFDATGRLTAITDLNGYTTTLSYPSSTQMLVTGPGGRTLTFTLTGSHVTSVADSASPPRTLSYGYDAAGNLTDVVDPAAGHWQFGYDAAHRMLTMRSPRFYGDTTTSPSPVVTNHYDSSGRVDWQTDPLGRQTSFDYTSVPGSTLVTDPAGNVRLDQYTYGLLTATLLGYGSSAMSSTYYRYDPDTLGQIKVINGDGKVTSTSYDAQGNPTAVTDPLGRTTSYTYNSLNEITSVTEPKQVNGVAVRTTTSYDAAGNVLTHSAPLLDANGAVTATATTTYHHDDPAHPGDVTSVTDPNNHTTVNSFDSYGDLVSVTDAVGDKTSYGYDTGRGLRTSMVAPKGNVTGANPALSTTSYLYDAAGRLTTVRDPLWNSANPTQNQVVRHYDADGNLTSVTDGDNHTTSYGYDAAGEQTSITRPNGSVQSTSYDGAGRKQVSYDGNNQQTYYSFDASGRLVYVSDPLGRSTRYGYDTAGLLITKTDYSGRITTNGYDAAGELTSISYSDGVTPNVSGITYDPDGQRISMYDGSGTSTWSLRHPAPADQHHRRHRSHGRLRLRPGRPADQHRLPQRGRYGQPRLGQRQPAAHGDRLERAHHHLQLRRQLQPGRRGVPERHHRNQQLRQRRPAQRHQRCADRDADLAVRQLQLRPGRRRPDHLGDLDRGAQRQSQLRLRPGEPADHRGQQHQLRLRRGGQPEDGAHRGHPDLRRGQPGALQHQRAGDLLRRLGQRGRFHQQGPDDHPACRHHHR
jgi:YD repeat-containing protein